MAMSCLFIFSYIENIIELVKLDPCMIMYSIYRVHTFTMQTLLISPTNHPCSIQLGRNTGFADINEHTIMNIFCLFQLNRNTRY